jgi:tRNA threonylcarbamoyladenosine modification (KEOPS) complex Cgi121 subunit
MSIEQMEEINPNHAILVKNYNTLLAVVKMIDSEEMNTLIEMCKPNSDVHDVLTSLRNAARIALRQIKKGGNHAKSN